MLKIRCPQEISSITVKKLATAKKRKKGLKVDFVSESLVEMIKRKKKKKTCAHSPKKSSYVANMYATGNSKTITK